MSLSPIAGFLLEAVLPLLAWAALIVVIVRWYFRRWETRLAAERSFKLRFPLSSMVFLSRKIVIEELLNDPELQAAVSRQARETGQAETQLQQGLRRQAQEMVPAFKAVFYFSIGYWLARTLLLTFYRVKLLRISSDDYAKIGRDATVVLFMNHRSNMDVLLVNFLASRRSTIAHAAGEWARMWPLHHLVRLAGNYVVDRDSNDPLYRLLLKRYVQMAVARGIHLGVFPEGSLTRDGRQQTLNFGLLNYVATAAWPGFDRDVVFIPVSFNYDRIPEQQRLVFEDERDFSKRGKIFLAFNTIKFCLKFLLTPLIPRHRRYGWACASFGEPVSLKQWQRTRGIELKSLSSEQRREHVEALGRQLMDAAADMMPVLPTHVLATALLEDPGSDWPEQQLLQRCAVLRAALETAGAQIFQYDLDEIAAYKQGLDKLQQLNILEVSGTSSQQEPIVRLVAGQLPMLQFYANSIAHYLESTDTPPGYSDRAIESSTVVERRKKYLRVVYESFERIQHSKRETGEFIPRFYQLFLASSPAIAEKFRDTDMPRLQLHLQQSLEHMVDFYITQKPSARLRHIAYSHSRSGRDIGAQFYEYWLDSLLGAAGEFDPDYEKDVELAWREIMSPGIAFMRSQYGVERVEAPAGDAADEDVPVEQQGTIRWIDHWARRTPDKLALRSADREVSYAQLRREVACLAAAMHHRLGIGVGDRVAFLSPNRVEFIALIFACARLGAIVVPVNFRLESKEQRAFIDQATASAVFVDAGYQQLLGDGREERPFVVLQTLLESVPGSREPAPPSGRLNSILYEDLLTVPATMTADLGRMDSPLFIFFTSGSTGQPKGAVLTQSAVHWNALNSRVMHDLNRTDHVLTTLPFFHVGGINIQTLPALQVGATVTIVPQFDAADFVRQVERDRHTLTVLVPTQMRQLMELPNWFSADLSSLKAIATGSTIVGKDLLQAWANKGLPIIQIYGCTESGPIAIHQTLEDSYEGLATAGYPALYTDVKLLDPQGRAVEQGYEGEIFLRGPHLMSQYWGDEEATGSTLRDGWLSTGDLGYQDEQGRLYVVGRIKRLIISGGENIHPAEVEEVLEHHPDIAEAAVVGVADPKWDEVPVALVVTAPGKVLDEAAVRVYLNQNLGRFKHPRRMLQAEELPATPLGKIDYPAVAALLSAEQGGA